MFCSECGSPIPDEARFCPECGAVQELASSEPEAVPTPEPVPTPVPEPVPAPVGEEAPASVGDPVPVPPNPTAPAAESLSDVAEQAKSVLNDLKDVAASTFEKSEAGEVLNDVAQQTKSMLSDAASKVTNAAENAKSAAASAAASTTAAAPKAPGKKLPTWAVIVAALVVLSMLGSCMSCLGGGSSSSSTSTGGEPWPTSGLAQVIPALDDTCSYVSEDNGELSVRSNEGIAKNDFTSYVDECKNAGFTVDADDSSDEYKAYNEGGYKLELAYQDESECVDIKVYDTHYKDLDWPSEGSAALIPNPEKLKGEVVHNASDNFEAYVCDVTAEEYKNYVVECEIADFLYDYEEETERYVASNEAGDVIQIEYQGFNTMHINLDVKNPTSASAEDSASDENAGEETDDESSDDDSDDEVVVTSIKAKYSGKKTAGTEIDDYSDITVTATYSDGTKDTVRDWEVVKAKKLKAGKTTKVTIKAEGKKCTLKVKCTTLTSKQYMKKCKRISYKKLARNPSKYEGKKVKFSGEIMQVQEHWLSDDVYLIRVTKDSWGYWDDIVYVRFENESDKRFLEDDIVAFYGEYTGIESYSAVSGATISVPSVDAKYMFLKK